MSSQSRQGRFARLVRQPATLILVLGSMAALVVGGSFNSTTGPKASAATDAPDPAIARLEAYAASQTSRLPQSRAAAPIREAGSELPDIATMAARLEARLANESGDADGWRLLGLSRAHLGDPAGAAVAYARALDLRPGDAELVAALGEARRASGAPAE